MIRSVLGVAALVAATGCVRSEVIDCGDGIVCPSDRTCTTFVNNNEERPLCVTPDQLTVCNDLLEDAICSYGDGETGTCKSNLCFPTVCGDGVVSGSEECEIGNQPFDVCSDLEGEFYDPVPLRCTGSCLYDRLACMQDGARYCGDDRIDYLAGEYCDGTALPFNNDSCVTFGYDAGELTCNENLCTPGFASCANIGWSFVVPGLMANDIWGAAPNDIYAVSDGGVLTHFDGGVWSNVVHNVPTDADFYGIYGTSATDIYVVGGSPAQMRENSPGVMLHFDGTAWTQVTLPVNKMLNAVWVSGTTGVAVGVNGTILRLANGTWTSVTSPTTKELFAVGGTSATAVWIGGYPDTAQDGLYKYDGTSVTPQAAPGSLLWTISAIHGVATGEVFIAGNNAGGDGVAARLDGANWTEIGVPECAAPIGDLWASSATDVYATSHPAFGLRRSHTLYHYDGASWTPVESPSAAGAYSVWGSGAGDVYVSSASGLTHGDGRIMTVVPIERANGDVTCESFLPNCSSAALSLIAGRDTDDVYAIGGTTLCHYDGHNWSGSTLPSYTYRYAWVSPQGKAFVVGSTDSTTDPCGPNRTTVDAVHIEGTVGSFTPVLQSPTGHSELLGVHGTSSSDVYAVGAKGTNACTLEPFVLHYNGVAWTEVPTTLLTNMDLIRRVWAKSPTEIYVMGDDGDFARYNGSTWTALPPVPTFCPPVMDMKGAGNDIYATCLSDRSVYRFDTTTDTWESDYAAHFANFGSRLRLLPFSATDIFVFGGDIAADGSISHYKSAKATPVRYEGEPISDAWGTPERIFWVGADGVHSLVRVVPW